MNNELFNELLTSIQEAGKIRRGELPATPARAIPEPDVKQIRKQIGFSQSKFSALIGVSIRTIQNWEQGHRRPTGAAKVLLLLVQADPEAICKNLAAVGR